MTTSRELGAADYVRGLKGAVPFNGGMVNSDIERLENVAAYIESLQQRIKRLDLAVDARIERCRKAVSDCPKWSPAQAEWSRARDELLNLKDDLAALKE